MNKDYLEKNNLTRICRTFLGSQVCCVVPNEVVSHANKNNLDNLNKSLAERFNYDLVEPTLKFLKDKKLAISISTHTTHDSELNHAIFYKKNELEKYLDSKFVIGDVYFFIYTSPATHHNLARSQYLNFNNAFNRFDSKLLGMPCIPHDTIKGRQILLCALPKALLGKETAIPDFVKEIIENQ